MKTIVGLFRDYADAESSISDLTRLGLAPSDVGLLTAANGHARKATMRELELPDIGRVEANPPMVAFLNTREAKKDSSGVFGMLLRMGINRNDATGYVEGIRHGDVFEAFDVPDDKEGEALAIMRQHAKSELDDRPRRILEQRHMEERGLAPDQFEQRTAGATEQTEIVIPVIEEELYVGKREEPAGVRVDTRVTSEPVERTISLLEERIDIERRRVDRLLDAETLQRLGERPDLFSERTFEMRAMGEEPYIEKRARVIEEIHIHKDRKERIETIRDTLRHTEVDINETSSEGSTLDAARFGEHYKKHYEPQKLSFDQVAPAYAFGERLRRRSSDGDWSAIESRISMNWERKNPGTWERFRDAIRAGWESISDKR